MSDIVNAIESALENVLDGFNITGVNNPPPKQISKIYAIDPCISELSAICILVHHLTKSAMPGCVIFTTPSKAVFNNIPVSHRLCGSCQLFSATEAQCLCPNRS